MLAEAAQHLDLSPPAPVVGNSSRSPAGLPQPRPPERIFCLCHRLITGPPDFRPYFERRMQWAPAAEHSLSGTVAGWREEWICNSCGGSVPLAAAWPTQLQSNCARCQGESVWVFDSQTQAGEWRCTRCMQDAFVAPVGQYQPPSIRAAMPDLSSEPSPDTAMAAVTHTAAGMEQAGALPTIRQPEAHAAPATAAQVSVPGFAGLAANHAAPAAPTQGWTPQALEAYELNAYHTASNRIGDLGT